MRALLFIFLFMAVPAAAHPVLMISVDGLRPRMSPRHPRAA